MSRSKKEDEKALKAQVKLLAQILSGESTYRDESVRLRRLGAETGPDLEDLLLALSSALSGTESHPDELLKQALPLSTEILGGVLEVLVTRGAAELVARLQHGRSDREGQKLCAGALHRLELRGIVPTWQPPRVQPVQPEDVSSLEAYVSTFMPGSERILLIFVLSPGRSRGFHLEFNEVVGLTDYAFRPSPRQFRREFFEALSQPGGQFWMELAPPELVGLLDSLVQTSRLRHREVPFELCYLLEDLRASGITGRPERIAGWESLPRSERPELAMLLHLCREPELLSMPIPQSLHEEMLSLSLETGESPLVLQEHIKQERVARVRRQVFERVCTPEFRARLGLRLHTLARRLERKGDLAGAQVCAQQALAVEDPTRGLEEEGFLTLFLDVTLFVQMEQALGREGLNQVIGESPGVAGTEVPETGPSPADDAPRIVLSSGR